MQQTESPKSLGSYLTVGQAAKFLGVSPWTLRNWDRAGKLKTLRHPKNGYRIYRREDLEAVLKPEGLRGRLSNRLTPLLDWSEMGEAEHFVHFYEADNYLVGSVSRFLGIALGSGDGAVLIATPEHRNAIQRKLRARGFTLAAARAEGRFVVLDASDTLSKFMVDGVPDPARFRKVIGGVVAGVTKRSAKVRAFGEMVALLWAKGSPDAAIRLEELWNELQQTHTFALYCAYPVQAFSGENHEAPFHQICSCHARVLPAESYVALSNESERLQAIARLQQKTQALRYEIAHRKEVEGRLIALQAQRQTELAELRDSQERAARSLDRS